MVCDAGGVRFGDCGLAGIGLPPGECVGNAIEHGRCALDTIILRKAKQVIVGDMVGFASQRQLVPIEIGGTV